MTADFVFKQMTGRTMAEWGESGELDWYSTYADPREDAGKGILTANWNHFPRVAAGSYPRTAESESAQEFNWGSKGRRFQAILEEMGYNLEWSDQTDRCEHCGGCIHTDASCYGDTAHYAILNECEIVCEECIRKDYTEEYLETLTNNPHAAVNIRGINPAKHGYFQVETGFENGFHPGQTDDPKKISARLTELGYTGLLFTIDGAGQFDVRFTAWAKGRPDMKHLQLTVELGAEL